MIRICCCRPTTKYNLKLHQCAPEKYLFAVVGVAGAVAVAFAAVAVVAVAVAGVKSSS